jgi:RHH-type proline utilization regulon transcriptional repressor/proline dehydrogenase/delta 1-pyrroline-5-carboxylate dehydrogenase
MTTMPKSALAMPSAQSSLPSLQHDISSRAFMDEAEALKTLIESLEPVSGMEAAIKSRAEALVKDLRKASGAGVEAFLHEYGLDTREGIAVMCLAEALLRIPDATTANRLIRDKLEGGEWEKYVGESDSFFVNASSWGLLLTGKVIDLGSEDKPSNIIGKLVSKFGEPVIREALKKAMRVIGGQFVLGEDVDAALDRSSSWLGQGYRFSYDILGEGARSDAQALHYVESYRHAITQIGAYAKNKTLYEAPGISVKLSALHPRYQFAKQERVLKELLPRLREILLAAKEHGITVSIDAEEATRLDIELILFSEIFADPAFTGWNGIGFVLQAYQKRAFYVIDYLRALAEKHHRIMPLRLVKGAYWDSEVKWAQVGGLPGYPVFTRKEHTDVSYLACANKILAAKGCFYPQFATHNARTVATIEALAKHYHVKPGDFEFQRLHGMGEKLHGRVVETHPCRIYAPVGPHKDLLAYLIRRLLENGANTSFVNLLMDENVSLSDLLADPVEKTAKNFLPLEGGGGESQTSRWGSHSTATDPHPSLPLSGGGLSLPLPHSLYGTARKNSAGLDLGNLTMMEKLEQQLASFNDARWSGEPMLAEATRESGWRDVNEPANLSRTTGKARSASKEDLSVAIEYAEKAFPRWAATPVSERARILNLAADKLEANSGELIALLSREAGKTISDGIAEVREAADFCRYYAAEAVKLMTPENLVGPTGESNRLAAHPRGIFGCISPWNFPLAIFTGQVVAALATGNCVLAKPADQTTLIAACAVALLHEAGIPKDVLQLVPGPGRVIGNGMVEDNRINGIVFTGSMETARTINQTLAKRDGAIPVLIAETGGQNCMVVDSSALIEQAIDDIILSAFGSAGQRCSALRVLYVQDDIADQLMELLAGAMQELKLGYPLELATDIGPVIDGSARKSLYAHIERMQQEARLVATAPIAPEMATQGYFVAPHAFEIQSIKQLPNEVFGPVLHIIRFKASELEKVASDINSTGFGLTFGLQSRIEDHVRFFTTHIKAGNMYINRSMTGAVVGVQPFGGEGLSGTGPKAGGPLYLSRFVTERTVTVNTAAIGGNLALLSGKSN